MKTTYFVKMNCINGSQTVLTCGSTVELPSEIVNQQLLDIFLASGALLPMASSPGEAPEVKPQATQSTPNKGT